MPRVHTRTKAARGKPYTCSTCGKEIQPGEEFYYWDFRYGGTRRSHTSHGYPRRSQLTQSRMGEVYDAVESVEALIASDGWVYEDVESAIEELKGVVDEVKTSYEEAAEHFGGQGSNQERAEELEPFADALDQIDLEPFQEDEVDEEREERKCITCAGAGKLDAEIDNDGNVIRTETCVDCGGHGHRVNEVRSSEAVEEKRQEWLDEIKGRVEEALSEAP